MTNNCESQLLKIKELQTPFQANNADVQLIGKNLSENQKIRLLEELTLVDNIETLKLEIFRITSLIQIELLKEIIIKNWKTLQTVELIGTHLGDDRFSSIAPMLKKCPWLKKLNLDLNDLSEQSMKPLSRIFKNSFNKFTLTLSHNHFESKAMETFAKEFNVKNLEIFSLSGNKIGDEGAKACLKKLMSAKNLRLLDLSVTQITNQTAAHLNNFLKNCHTLLSLNLRGNCLKNITFFEISETIQYHPSLLDINIINTYCTHHGIRAFLEIANESCAITNVMINPCHQKKEADKYYAELFKKYPKLNKIDNVPNPKIHKINDLSQTCLKILKSRNSVNLTNEDLISVKRHAKQISQRLFCHLRKYGNNKFKTPLQIGNTLIETIKNQLDSNLRFPNLTQNHNSKHSKSFVELTQNRENQTLIASK